MLKDVRALGFGGFGLAFQGYIEPSKHLGRLSPQSDVFFSTSVFEDEEK